VERCDEPPRPDYDVVQRLREFSLCCVVSFGYGLGRLLCGLKLRYFEILHLRGVEVAGYLLCLFYDCGSLYFGVL